MMGRDLLGTHLLNDNDRLAVVSIPPDVIPLDVGIWPLCSYRSGFTSTGRSPVPFILEVVQGHMLILHDVIEI